MINNLVFIVLILVLVLPVSMFLVSRKKSINFRKSLVLNIVSFFTILLFSVVFIFTTSASASEVVAPVVDNSRGMAYIGAALAVGLGSIAAGIATGSAASAALGAISENEEIMGRALIFVALAEGISIFGLIIAFMILNG